MTKKKPSKTKASKTKPSKTKATKTKASKTKASKSPPSDAALRATLEEIGGLRPPATPAALDAAEQELGCSLPPLLRQIYRVSNGLDHPDAWLFPLEAEDPDGCGLLNQWRQYREDWGDADAKGYIGCDAYPIGSVFGDADTFVLRTNRAGVFEHYPDDGCLKKRFASVEAWLENRLQQARREADDDDDDGDVAPAPLTPLEQAAARAKALRADGVKAWCVREMLKGIPSLMDDPQQSGDWTAALIDANDASVAGDFRVVDEAASPVYAAVLRQGLLRLVAQEGKRPPRWKAGTLVGLVEARQQAAAAPGAPSPHDTRLALRLRALLKRHRSGTVSAEALRVAAYVDPASAAALACEELGLEVAPPADFAAWLRGLAGLGAEVAGLAARMLARMLVDARRPNHYDWTGPTEAWIESGDPQRIQAVRELAEKEPTLLACLDAGEGRDAGAALAIAGTRMPRAPEGRIRGRLKSLRDWALDGTDPL